MKQEYTRVVVMTITPEQIADLIITAFEGGISYWCGSADLIKGETTERPWYSDPKLYEQDFQVRMTDVEDDTIVWTLGPADLRQGIEKLPEAVLDRILRSDYDADDADTFIQLCLFGELVYG